MSFYAEFCPRGVNVVTDSDELAQFDTREERDEWCSRINARCDYGREVWRPVTVREIAHRYSVREFRDGEAHEIAHERTCKGEPVFTIHQRRFYCI